MELIVRTAHGTADVSIDVHGRGVSLRDLIASVTGQAAPNTALVDGQLANTSDTLASCGVVNGSVVDTLLDDHDERVASPIVVLRQLSGPGAGRSVRLGTGQYRVGPGRRQHAAELSDDDVDVVAFNLDVTTTSVIISAGPQSVPATAGVTLGGRTLDEPTPWKNESVVVGGRVFRLEQPNSGREQDAGTPVDGFLIHNRPPGLTAETRTIAEALDEAHVRSPRLWHRRTDHHPASTNVGLLAQPGDGGAVRLESISLELGRRHLLAVAGGQAERAALARAIVVDLCTQYGPADIDVVIATTPSELGDWDWAKWLPHLRMGTAVDLLTNELELAHLANRQLARSTVVIVTADAIWNGPSSPLRPYVLDPPNDAAIVVLTDDRASAPATAKTIIELESERPGTATLTHLTRGGAELSLHVPLLDIDTAAHVARRLAPLIDPDRSTSAGQVNHLVPLDRIVRVSEASVRWDTALGTTESPIDMSIGVVANTVIGVDFGADRSAVISGSSIDEAVQLATVLTLSIASTWSPTEASLLLVDHRTANSDGALQRLPHHAGTFSARDQPTIDQLLTRLRADFAGERPQSTRLVVVINSIAETELAAPGLIDELIDLAAASVGIHLIVATARPLTALSPNLRSVCSIEIAVDSYGGVPRATLHERHRALQTAFTPVTPFIPVTPFTPVSSLDEETSVEPITVRPFVFGRAPSALERHLEHGPQHNLHDQDQAVERSVRQLAALAAQHRAASPRRLVPVPLPSRVIASDLWATHLGDGVPLGLFAGVDDGSPAVYWWQPGRGGSRIFVGSPRSGVRSALEALLVGVTNRFATADIELYISEHNDRRRNSIAALPHVVRAESPDHEGAVEAMLNNVAAEMHLRRGTAKFRVQDHPSILVIARDVERLTRPATAALTHLLAEGEDVGINVVVAAHQPVGLDDIVRACDQTVVGALNNPDHYAQLGVERAPVVEQHVGRVQLSDNTVVQLATLDAPLDDALIHMTTMSATD